MRFIVPVTVLNTCYSSGFEEVPIHSHAHNTEWSKTKNLIHTVKDEIRLQDQVALSLDTDASAVGPSGFLERIPVELIHHTPEIAGEYDLENLVKHDEAHLMIGTHTLQRSKRFIFKYQMNCFANIWNKKFCKKKKKSESCLLATRDPEALLEEYVLTRVVYERLGLAPKPFFLSPPVILSRENFSVKGKTEFSLLENGSTSPEDCAEVAASMRLLVEEFVGLSIADYFKSFTQDENPDPLTLESVQLAARIFKQSIGMLQQLHSIGIVHGDFHYGNLAFRSSAIDLNRETLDLVFIDFGTAKFFPDDIGIEYTVSPLRYYFFSPNLLSPFQLEGHITARRDDIYRAFESFMNVLTQGNLERLLESPINGKVEYLKSEMNFCGFSETNGNYRGLNSVHQILSNDNFIRIYAYLRKIQDYVRDGQNSVFSEPNYEFLVDHAQSIINILSI